MRYHDSEMNYVTLASMLGPGASLKKKGPWGGAGTEPGEAVYLRCAFRPKKIELYFMASLQWSSKMGSQRLVGRKEGRDEWVYEHCRSPFPYVVKDPDFGTYRSWLHEDRDEIDRQDVFELLRMLMQYTTFFEGDDMQPLKDYTVAWLVKTLREMVS